METCSASSALNIEKSHHEKEQIGVTKETEFGLIHPHCEQLEDTQSLKYEEKLRDVECSA